MKFVLFFLLCSLLILLFWMIRHPKQKTAAPFPVFLHPEQKKGEAFVGYRDMTSCQKIPYKGKRYGTRVFQNGKEIDVSETRFSYRLFPVFAPAAEVAAMRNAILKTRRIDLVHA
jgi:hypothetical protein